MEVPDNLLCVFSARVEEQRDSYVIEVPKREITNGDVQHDEVYRTALLSPVRSTDAEADERSPGDEHPRSDEHSSGVQPKTEPESETRQERDSSGPPVQEGDVREVEIDDLGDEGDGIARVERGYVIIVPDADKGERMTIEITNVRENVAFSEIVEREEYFH